MTNPACKNCDRQDHCKMYADAKAFYADVAEFGCKHFKPKQTKTNADRIRAMSDEKLAEWLGDMLGVYPFGTEQWDRQAWLDWLKKEVTE